MSNQDNLKVWVLIILVVTMSLIVNRYKARVYQHTPSDIEYLDYIPYYTGQESISGFSVEDFSIAGVPDGG